MEGMALVLCTNMSQSLGGNYIPVEVWFSSGSGAYYCKVRVGHWRLGMASSAEDAHDKCLNDAGHTNMHCNIHH